MNHNPAVLPLQLRSLLFLLTLLLLFVDICVRQWLVQCKPPFSPFNIFPPFTKLMSPSEDVLRWDRHETSVPSPVARTMCSTGKLDSAVWVVGACDSNHILLSPQIRMCRRGWQLLLMESQLIQTRLLYACNKTSGFIIDRHHP